MQIRRVILKGVRNFVDFDRSFEDSWSGRVPDSLLLIGPNGSGKTTLLNVIADLWDVLANCIRASETPPLPGVIFPSLPPSKLAAIEIAGLEQDPLWVVYADARANVDDDYDLNFVKEFASVAPIDSHRVGVFHVFLRSGLRLQYWYARPGATEAEEDKWFWEWQQPRLQRLIENVLGKRQDLPNIVYLESETRVLLPLSEKFSVQPEPEEFRWLARYELTTSRKGSLQNYLYNLKVVDEVAFESIVEEANKFLIGKRLNGFDKRTGDLMVKIDGGGRHPITDLSSGEKQVLLMLATITRWLRPGGIVLIDEPDLHLHSSLTTAFVGHLRRMVAEKSGQLIIASHAPELLQDFTTSHRVELGSLSEVVR